MKQRWNDRRGALLRGTCAQALSGGLLRSPASRMRFPNGAKSSHVVVAAKPRRRAAIEALEPRILLNADLTGDAGALTSGMQALETWIETLESHQALAQSIPVINRTLGTAVDFGGTVATYLTDKIEDYLDPSGGDIVDDTPTGDELVAALNGTFTDALGEVTVQVSHSGSDPVFDVSVTRTVAPGDVSLDLSADDGGLGLSLNASGDLTTDFVSTAELQFGIDGIGFYVTPTSLQATVTGALTGFATNVDLGFVDFDATVDAAVNATATVTPVAATLRTADLTGAIANSAGIAF